MNGLMKLHDKYDKHYWSVLPGQGLAVWCRGCGKIVTDHKDWIQKMKYYIMRSGSPECKSALLRNGITLVDTKPKPDGVKSTYGEGYWEWDNERIGVESVEQAIHNLQRILLKKYGSIDMPDQVYNWLVDYADSFDIALMDESDIDLSEGGTYLIIDGDLGEYEFLWEEEINERYEQQQDEANDRYRRGYRYEE